MTIVGENESFLRTNQTHNPPFHHNPDPPYHQDKSQSDSKELYKLVP